MTKIPFSISVDYDLAKKIKLAFPKNHSAHIVKIIENVLDGFDPKDVLPDYKVLRRLATTEYGRQKLLEHQKLVDSFIKNSYHFTGQGT